MIKVRGVAYVRFGAPDLDKMQSFLLDFGLRISQRDEDRLYMRGTDPSPYVHVTELGEAGFRGLAFEAGSAADLARASKLPGASEVEDIDEPWGGQRVRFRDPDGFPVEVVHGRKALSALEAPVGAGFNRGSERVRFGTLCRVPAGPASVKRLGHVVVKVSNFETSAEWYKSHFGFVSSDDVYLGEKENILTSFLRCDLGSEYTDHHSLLCIGLGDPEFDHAAFEVEDLDAVMTGHEHLAAKEYDHHAGIGRHILGSQIFDYWRDPWGHTMEHFTDGDLLNDQHETGLCDPMAALGTQWGKFGP
jgi:catechol 2,3-dioxygenase-like lactoylglutathione lyase family enzyme